MKQYFQSKHYLSYIFICEILLFLIIYCTLGDVAQSQVSTSRKEIDELKLKLQDYEKMNKFQKVVSSDDKQNGELQGKLDDLKKQLSSEQRERKSEVNTLKMKYDSKTALMGEEILSLKAQSAKYRRERETYKEMVESAQKNRSGRTSAQGGDEVSQEKQICHTKVLVILYNLMDCISPL